MLNVRIIERREAARGTVQLTLAGVDQPLPPFEPGAHIDVVMANGLTRQYSLCGDLEPGAPYRIAVALADPSRGGSAFVHEAMSEGTALQISAPRNLFPLDEAAQSYVLMAGGIGVTPILPMAWRLHQLGKPFTLYYCARSREACAFLEELETAPFRRNIVVHLGDEASAPFDMDAALASNDTSKALYVCGPTGFMDRAFERAQALGWRQDELHREDFAAKPLGSDQDRPFTLTVSGTGDVIEVPVGVTAAQALEAAGYFVPLSCEQGICGGCLTPVLEGVPDHRDQFQTDEERAANTQFTPCCSRAAGDRLVIDI